MRGDGLPSIGSPNERVREPDDYVIARPCEIPGPVGAARHNSGIAKQLNPDIVDFKAVNRMHSLLEYIGKDAGPITRTPIWPRASPFGRNDPLDRGPVAPYPGLRQVLLDLCERCSILIGPAIQIRRDRRVQHDCQDYGGKS